MSYMHPCVKRHLAFKDAYAFIHSVVEEHLWHQNTRSLSSRWAARAEVAYMDLSGPMGQRLLDIGFTAGTEVACLYAAPSGEPRAYLVRGAVIALREEDAAHICILEGQTCE